MSQNISKLSGRKGLENNLFEKITAFAEQGRTPTDEDMDAIAKEFFIGKSSIASSTSFYDYLSEEHINKQAFVCNGSACLCARTQEKVIATLAEKMGEDKVGHVTCLGRCHENSSFQLNGQNYSGDAINHIDEILKDSSKYQTDNYNIICDGPALLTAEFSDIKKIKQQIQQFLSHTPEALVEEMKVSNIRGRGGAGFPAGMKWESCKNVVADGKYIVCNADEGDPGAYSDRYLLEQQPYRVLFGMMAAAYIVEAQYGVIYIRAEYPEAITAVQRAIETLEANGLHGENILDSGFNFKFKIVKGAGAYICGEETALIASIEGRRPEVDMRPPFPTVEGLFKKPTVLNNVETFAAVPAIFEMGGTEFAKIGSEQSSGTKLLCLDGLFNKPGLLEVPMGTSLRMVVDEIGGGFIRPVKALHIGGPLGGLIPISKVDELTVDFESFAKEGFLLGHGSIVCIPEDFSLIEYLEHLFEFTAAESCGKCFPCRLGATRGREMLQRVITDGEVLDRALFEDLLDTMQQASLCALGGGLPLPIKNALQYFDDELGRYFAAGKIASAG